MNTRPKGRGVNKPPYFPFYPGDYLSDANVAMMSCAEQGAYLRLLCYEWIEEGLPDDHEMLSRMAGVSLEEFEQMWTQLKRCFTVRGKKLIQKRLEAEREKVKSISSRNSRSAKSRWGNEIHARACDRSATAVRPQCDQPHSERNPIHIHSHSQIQNEPTAHVRVITRYSDLYEKVTGEKPPIGGKVGKLVKELLEEHPVEEVLQHLEICYQEKIPEFIWSGDGTPDFASFKGNYARCAMPKDGRRRSRDGKVGSSELDQLAKDIREMGL